MSEESFWPERRSPSKEVAVDSPRSPLRAWHRNSLIVVMALLALVYFLSIWVVDAWRIDDYWWGLFGRGTSLVSAATPLRGLSAAYCAFLVADACLGFLFFVLSAVVFATPRYWVLDLLVVLLPGVLDSRWKYGLGMAYQVMAVSGEVQGPHAIQSAQTRMALVWAVGQLVMLGFTLGGGLVGARYRHRHYEAPRA